MKVDRVRRWLVVAVLVLVMFPFTPVVFRVHPGGYEMSAIMWLADLPVGLLVVASMPGIVAAARRRDRLAAVLVALVVWLVVSFVVTPSDRGALQLLRVAGLVAIAVTVAEQRSPGRFAAVIATACAAVQAVISLAQIVTGRAVLGGLLAEHPKPLLDISGSLAPQGTELHPYLLMWVALVGGGLAAWRFSVEGGWRWASGTAVAVAPVGFTYSRAGLIGVACAAGALVLGGLLRRDRRRLGAAGLLVAGFALAAVTFPGGWTGRVEESRASVASGRASDLGSGRSELFAQAFDLIGEHPVFGVGLGRYGLELHAVHPDLGWLELRPVHNVPLFVTAEGGVPAGVLYVAAVALVVLAARRLGAGAFGLSLAVCVVLLVDRLGWSFPPGLFTTGLWIGAIWGERAAAVVPVSP